MEDGLWRVPDFLCSSREEPPASPLPLRKREIGLPWRAESRGATRDNFLSTSVSNFLSTSVSNFLPTLSSLSLIQPGVVSQAGAIVPDSQEKALSYNKVKGQFLGASQTVMNMGIT